MIIVGKFAITDDDRTDEEGQSMINNAEFFAITSISEW
jgi:hypothetical protein